MKLETKMALDALGKDSKRLWTDEKFTWQQLSSQNWKARFVAQIALIDVWNISKQEILQLSKTIIRNDNNDQVICCAIQSIGNALAGSYDDSWSQFLAEIVLSYVQPENVRIDAYLAIEQINNPVSSLDDLATIPEKIDRLKKQVHKIQNRSMNDIDWDLVNSKIQK